MVRALAGSTKRRVGAVYEFREPAMVATAHAPLLFPAGEPAARQQVRVQATVQAS
jgi:hypothetical protein